LASISAIASETPGAVLATVLEVAAVVEEEVASTV